MVSYWISYCSQLLLQLLFQSVIPIYCFNLLLQLIFQAGIAVTVPNCYSKPLLQLLFEGTVAAAVSICYSKLLQQQFHSLLYLEPSHFCPKIRCN